MQLLYGVSERFRSKPIDLSGTPFFRLYFSLMSPALIVLVGPTGVGKTELSLRLAERYGAPILSADSRQIYRDIPVGTAAPTAEQRQRVKHYFVAELGLEQYYSAACYEEEVMRLLPSLFAENPVAVLTGGSMMYIDAVCNGIDEIPTISDDVRRAVCDWYEREGLQPLLHELQRLDPQFYEQVDRCNPKRVIHALEVCRMTGRPYSELRTRQSKPRPFRIIKVGLTRPREELYDRINRRVDEMMQAGMLDEARRVYPLRHCNSLNTVGYKELFAYFDGVMPLDAAIEKIKRNTRVYSRKQMTWFKRDASIRWFSPDDFEPIRAYIDGCLQEV